MKSKILVVEDDPNLGFVVKDNLEQNNYDVLLCVDGEQALSTIRSGDHDLCILDIMLPKIDGLTLAKEIRKNDIQVPILFLSAKSLDEDKLTGFKIGADDYITKPFSMEELLCRIEVFLKRSSPKSPTQRTWTLGKYIFDYSSITLENGDHTHQLTRRESDILQLLCENRDGVIKREEILERIWGENDYFKGRSLDVFISKLRKYLSDDPNVDIQNYHGVGFKLEVKGN